MNRSTPFLLITGLFLLISIAVVYFILGGGNLFNGADDLPGNDTIGSGIDKDIDDKMTDGGNAAPEATQSSGARDAVIQGSLGYPSEVVPEDMRVCAENQNTGEIFCTDEHLEGEEYTYGLGYRLEVNAGVYHVYAMLPGDDGGWSGYRAYYNEFVECGLTVECEDHTPISINIEAGETRSDVDPIDWYDTGPDGQNSATE